MREGEEVTMHIRPEAVEGLKHKLRESITHSSLFPDSCWLWLGGTSNGYPVLKVHGKRLYARRLAYLLYYPLGVNRGVKDLGDRTIRDSCGQKCCINPSHLFPADWDKGGSKNPEPGKGNRYPWDLWFYRASLSTVTLLRGRDFECLPHGLAQQARNRASQLRFRLQIRVDEDRITLRARGSDPSSLVLRALATS